MAVQQEALGDPAYLLLLRARYMQFLMLLAKLRKASVSPAIIHLCSHFLFSRQPGAQIVPTLGIDIWYILCLPALH